MTSLKIECEPQRRGWRCHVLVGDDPDVTSHQVTVTRLDMDRFDPGTLDPTELVRTSFDFLLEREPRESILPTFGLGDIARYFAEYENTMLARMRPS
ncbi:MAG: hypothetical protein H0V12_02325 [Chloroflexi bacterium]|nr:hypothetical protein [Chloroflexota bacterium]